VPEHPNSTKNGYVLEHRIVMENHLNRLLTADEIVHHINHDGKDNRIENLEVMTRSEHGRHHAKLVGKKMAELKCPNCESIFFRSANQTYLVGKSKYTCCSASCRGKLSRFIQLNGETAEVLVALSENLIREYRSYNHLD